jgi:hypothetical protein
MRITLDFDKVEKKEIELLSNEFQNLEQGTPLLEWQLEA